ncbi:MAG: hypothetical protein JWN40_144 [Phycisphaerales bacterium]|nr:hypothetical protein [Phycisphaerales bacterium]
MKNRGSKRQWLPRGLREPRRTQFGPLHVAPGLTSLEIPDPVVVAASAPLGGTVVLILFPMDDGPGRQVDLDGEVGVTDLH